MTSLKQHNGVIGHSLNFLSPVPLLKSKDTSCQWQLSNNLSDEVEMQVMASLRQSSVTRRQVTLLPFGKKFA
jgi:hypothetical protein